MENLIFSFNATAPVFLLMVFGLFLRKINWISESFASQMNTFVFKVALPLMVFSDLATVDFSQVWDVKFLLYCFFVTIASITIAFIVSCFLKDKSLQGEFVQASYRSSAVILGMAFIQNIYGHSGSAPLMIIASVPLYNICAVIVLSLLPRGRNGNDPAVMKKTLIGILTNPILIGIALGLIWSRFSLPLPYFIRQFVLKVGSTATPLGLLSMGAMFDLKKALDQRGPALTAALMKLVGFVIVFSPIAVLLGFRNEQLVTILVMLGSATTVSSFVMARNMGHEGVLSSGVVMVTTLGSVLSLTFWLFLVRSLGFI